MTSGRQILIFDADDTLWENNVLFENAIETFIDHVIEPGRTREEIRAVLDEIEAANSRRYGYGCAVFERSLGECLARLGAAEPDEEKAAWIRELCRPIRECAVEVIPGVHETLTALRDRHDLFLLTKGDPDEQHRKIHQSGLAGFFEEVTIVAEKTPAVFERYVGSRGFDHARTWMIGNSPRSDILPALAARLGAVLVHHPLTWALEHVDLPEESDRFRRISRIRQLTRYF